MLVCGKSRVVFQRRRYGRDDGYILITLVLFVALLAISAALIAPLIAFQSKRDKEEEMIHRGVQYSRAIRHYYKKFNRYPTRLEDLDDTNNLRFLRKRYKDPITGQDFKILHFGEVQMGLGGIPGGLPAGMTQQGGVAGPQGFAQMGPAMYNQGGAKGPGQPFGQQPGAPGTFGGQNPGGFSPFGPAPGQPPPVIGGGPGQPGAPGGGDQSGTGTGTTGSTDSSGQPGDGGSGTQSSNPQAPGQGGQGGGGFSGQVFGGGPIIGVVSTSDKQTIREFNKKNHYKDWFFVYDPSLDRGGLLNTPMQPPLQGAGFSAPGQPGGGIGGAVGGPGGTGLPGGPGQGPGGSPNPPPAPPPNPTPQ